MLSPEKRELLKEIMQRVASGSSVTLEERKYLHKYADKDQTIASWLHSARREQLKGKNETDQIETLLDSLNLGSIDPDASHFQGDDLADFFIGAPSWLARS
ncbi:hypothetical protein [Prochlorococcus sp. MIT 1341]|uniref:hypothetical protein n=1 Tax=Prochlorococcus sp. MIT 1341 TaxID=3096221 RepID=UPI002A754E0F|nr:hypothetical protein [Prochlorococcus sp. MIT 1341]